MTHKLESVFDLLCEDFEKHLKNETLSNADRKLLIEFLKDQGISTVGKNNQKIRSIVERLPFDEDNIAINQ